ncbi:DUF456 domain-containing protein [Chryseobacterium sp.]|uniref:DUF456 domain-containing protein n=1 Tax=Chryseobacterium sp. TaxID=1871047 RepID=UPI00388EB5F3
MDIYLLNIVCIVLLILGIIGTVLPVLPGLVLSIAGVLIYKFGTDADLSMVYIYIFALLTIASVVLNYTIPAKTTKKYGGTTWGSIGSVIGTIVGFFIPIPLGFLIGMFAGVLVGELLHDRNDMKKAINSTKGALIGFIYGTGFSIMVGIAMLTVVVLNMMNII